MVKSMIFFPNVDLDSSKEALGGTECNAKKITSICYNYTEKIKKKLPKVSQNGNFWRKFVFFEVFLGFFGAIKINIQTFFFTLRGDPCMGRRQRNRETEILTTSSTGPRRQSW